MLFSQARLHHHWGQARRFMGDAYAHGRKWAGMIDGYANLATKVLGAAAPMLHDMGAGSVIAHGKTGLDAYHSARKRVEEIDDKARGHVERIAAAF